MPTFKLEMSNALVGRLQAIVQRYNANSGQDLTVAQWVQLHLKELAVQEELAAAAQALERSKQEELAREVEAARDRLLSEL